MLEKGTVAGGDVGQEEGKVLDQNLQKICHLGFLEATPLSFMLRTITAQPQKKFCLERRLESPAGCADARVSGRISDNLVCKREEISNV